jgi:hypothetical protein
MKSISKQKSVIENFSFFFFSPMSSFLKAKRAMSFSLAKNDQEERKEKEEEEKKHHKFAPSL